MAKTVLIVEDDEQIRFALRDILTSSKYDILLAENGQVGQDVATAKHPDLILLDYMMPVKNGIEMLDALRQDEWGKTVPVIFLTNSDDFAILDQALKDDIKDYVIKTEISSSGILALVARYLDGTITE